MPKISYKEFLKRNNGGAFVTSLGMSNLSPESMKRLAEKSKKEREKRRKEKEEASDK